MFKCCILALLLAAFPLHAKTLDGRVGAGMTIMDFNRSAALSLKYHATRYVDVTGLVGFDTEETKNSTLFGGQIHRNFSIEENMNFFLGMGIYALSEKSTTATGSANTSGVEADGLLGAEFFFPGLSNLGFQFQTGIGVKTLRKLSVKVLGDGFAGIGIHYYL